MNKKILVAFGLMISMSGIGGIEAHAAEELNTSIIESSSYLYNTDEKVSRKIECDGRNVGYATFNKDSGEGLIMDTTSPDKDTISIKKAVNGEYTSEDARRIEIGSKFSTESVFSIDKESPVEYTLYTNGVYKIGRDVVEIYTPTLNTQSIDNSIGYKGVLSFTDGTEVISTMSSNESVVKIDLKGNYEIVGEGVAEISLISEGGVYSCKVNSVKPVIDTSDVKLKDVNQSIKIDVINNKSGLPVTYSVVKGSAVISPDGLVSSIGKGENIVEVNIGGIKYQKKIINKTEQELKWEEMQPYIEECLGTPYVMGGVTPKEQLDCSGYVWYVYNKVGLFGERTTAQGQFNATNRTDNPQPGDLVFFHSTYDCPEYITHVGIYAGDGMMYHSGDPNQLTSIDTPYWQEHLSGFGTVFE